MIIEIIIATRRKKKVLKLSKKTLDELEKLELQEIFSEQAYFD